MLEYVALAPSKFHCKSYFIQSMTILALCCAKHTLAPIGGEELECI
jgi:hypothetical protein